MATQKGKKPPPLPTSGGTGKPPPIPKWMLAGSTSKSKSSGSAERTVKEMLKKAPGLRPYQAYIFAAAKAYHLDPVYITAVLMTEDTSGNPKARNPSGALGLAQILDGTVGNYNPRMNLIGLNGSEYRVGQAITPAMKESPVFAIAYLAWRLKGAFIKGEGWPGAYAKGYGAGPAAGAKAQSFIPNNYVPNATNAASGSVDTSAIASGVKGVVATGQNPFVIFKNGKISYSIYLTKNVLTYDGVPIQRSTLMREVQDKAGIGGDYYNFTGKSPTPGIVAGIMATGRNLQQIENHWIMDKKTFSNSPAGKKYFAGYQDAWAQVMGRNKPVPWQLVQEAAQSNLNETEFAARLRMDGFKGQKENKQWSYLNSNEYQSRVDAYTMSYEKIYGQHMTDQGFKTLASDAALAGWDPTQWEAYLRSLPQYTSTKEYQGHALGILNKLGMDFGMEFGLGAGGYTPPSGADQLPGPPGDKRVNKGKPGSPASAGNGLGVTTIGMGQPNA